MSDKQELTDEQKVIKRAALFDQAMAYQLEHYGGDGVEELARKQRDAMVEAGLDDAMIYASIKTGRMVSEANIHLLSKENITEWEDAVAEYRKPLGLEGCTDPTCPNCGADAGHLNSLNWDKEALAQFVAKALIAVLESDAGKAATSLMSVAKAAAIKERFAKEIAEAAEKALVMLITGGHGEEVVEGARSCVDIEIVENRLAIRAVVTKIKNEKLTAKLFFDISHAEHEVTVKSVPFLSEV